MLANIKHCEYLSYSLAAIAIAISKTFQQIATLTSEIAQNIQLCLNILLQFL